MTLSPGFSRSCAIVAEKTFTPVNMVLAFPPLRCWFIETSGGDSAQLRRPRLSGNIPLTPGGCRGFPDKVTT